MGLYNIGCFTIPWFKNFPMVYFKTTAKFWKSIEFFLTLGDMDQVNRPIGPGPLNITFRSDMPITFFISEFTTYIDFTHKHQMEQCDVQRSRTND